MIWNKKIKKEIPVDWNIKRIGDIIVEKEKSTIQVGDAKKQNRRYSVFYKWK